MTQKRKGLIVGVANENSIAWGCAKILYGAGADIALTWHNEKTREFIAPLAREIEAPIFMPMDVTNETECRKVFDAIRSRWGTLDFIIHSIAFAPKSDLQGRVTDCSRDGFLTAMDVSCHSLIRLTKAAESLMPQGGSVLTMSYYGAEKVVENYGLMGPVKAALESCVRYLAVELGPKNIRVNALSPGPVLTRAASGLTHFDALLARAAEKAPLHDIVTIEQIGEAAAFLVSDKARHITGQIVYVDNGVNLKGT